MIYLCPRKTLPYLNETTNNHNWRYCFKSILAPSIHLFQTSKFQIFKSRHILPRPQSSKLYIEWKKTSKPSTMIHFWPRNSLLYTHETTADYNWFDGGLDSFPHAKISEQHPQEAISRRKAKFMQNKLIPFFSSKTHHSKTTQAQILKFCQQLQWSDSIRKHHSRSI